MLNPLHLVRSPRWWQFVLAGYWLTLFTATHIPLSVPQLPSDPPDKLFHVVAYAGLAVLLATVWQLAMGRLTLPQLCGAWVALLLYGAVDEFTQIPLGRTASGWDWLADAIGAAIGFALFFTWNQVRRVRNDSSSNHRRD
jgi:VanZ family protein